MITLEGIDPKMIANNLMPSNPVHPGSILKEEIKYRGLSQKKLAMEMGISPSLLNELLNEKRAVTAEYALLFEATLGIKATICLWCLVCSSVMQSLPDCFFHCILN